MADKWQIWYPHKIDAWQGSATIQTFSDAAYRGYHNLIMAQFQSDDGMLPDDDRALAKESRLGPRWPEFAEEIRAHLKTDVPGRVYSATQYELWRDAHTKHLEYLERMETARLTKALRKAQAAGDTAEVFRLNQLLNAQSNTHLNTQSNIQNNTPTVDSSTHNSMDSLTETVTEIETVTEKEKHKNTCAEASSAPALDPDGMPLVLLLNDGSEYVVPAKDCVRWASSYPAVNVLTELLKMREWCISHARERKTRRGIRAFITGWLGRAQDKGHRNYGTGFNGGHSSSGQARSDANDAAARRAAEAIVARDAKATSGGAWG